MYEPEECNGEGKKKTAGKLPLNFVCAREERSDIVSICLPPCYSCTWRRTSRRATSTWATVWRARWSAAARRPTPSRWPTSRWYGGETTRRRTRTRIPPSVRPHPRSPSVGTASITRSWEARGAAGRSEMHYRVRSYLRWGGNAFAARWGSSGRSRSLARDRSRDPAGPGRFNERILEARGRPIADRSRCDREPLERNNCVQHWDR